MTLKKNPKRRKRNLAYSKKGNAVADSLIIVVMLFVFAVSSFIAYKAYVDLKPTLDEEFTDSNASSVNDDLYSRTPTMLDSLLAVALVILWIGSVALAFFVDTHPVWFVLSLILMVFVLIIAGFLSNAFVEINDDLGIGTNFPMMSFVFTNLLAFILGVIISVVMALYAKSRR